jgi:hypothetical protein
MTMFQYVKPHLLYKNANESVVKKAYFNSVNHLAIDISKFRSFQPNEIGLCASVITDNVNGLNELNIKRI